MLKDVSGPCLLHIGHKTMDENVAGEFLWSNGLAEPEDVERLLQPPQGLFRGQVLGLLDLDKTRRYTEEETRQSNIQTAVASEVVGKWATPVRRAWWLKIPLRVQGQPGVWTVRLPRDAAPLQALPLLGLSEREPAGTELSRNASDESMEQLPRLMVFDLDGVCWSPEMYQTKGGPPYQATAEGAVNSAGEEIRLFPAVRRVWGLLQSAASQGIRVAVASSSRRHKALPLLKTIEVTPGVSMMDLIDQRISLRCTTDAVRASVRTWRPCWPDLVFSQRRSFLWMIMRITSDLSGDLGSPQCTCQRAFQRILGHMPWTCTKQGNQGSLHVEQRESRELFIFFQLAFQGSTCRGCQVF
ncbi:unnamed protein product [Effrenium voratum]|nr:unnamed protein product [Effrenium voratum]